MLKTIQTDAVIQAILKERSERLTKITPAMDDCLEGNILTFKASDEISVAWGARADPAKVKASIVKAAMLLVVELERIERAENSAKVNEAIAKGKTYPPLLGPAYRPEDCRNRNDVESGTPCPRCDPEGERVTCPYEHDGEPT